MRTPKTAALATAFALAAAAVLALAAARAEDLASKPAPDDGAARADSGAPSAAEKAFAVTVSVRGKVDVDAEAGRRPLGPRDLLAAGDVVLPEEGAEAKLLARDGRCETITTPREIGAGADPNAPPARAFLAYVREVERLANPPPSLVMNSNGGDRLRGDPGMPVPISPRARILTARPTFVWRDAAAAGRPLRLVVERVVGGEARPLFQVAVAGDRYTPPADAPPLEPGLHRFYLESPAGEAPLRSERAGFFVVDAAAAARIGAEREAYERALPDDAAVRHALLACFYRLDGIYLLEEARRELRAAVDAAPGYAFARELLERTEIELGLR